MSVSDKRFVLLDNVMKYQVCFIVAIDEIYETIHHRGWSVMLLSRRGFIPFFFLRPLRSEKSAHLHLSRRIEKRKMPDADYDYL